MSTNELESDSYDVVVLGTGLAESIAAAALAKIGKSVLHLDPNEYYAADQASLTLDELVKWASDRSSTSGAASSSDAAAGAGSSYLSSQKRRFTHATTSILTPDLERDRRRYALSLYPAILPARGTLISTLIASDVSKYVGFRLLDSVGVWEEGRCSSSSENAGAQAQAEAAEPQVGGQVRRVPGNKEDVFKDKSVGLVDKRRLMKFLMWVARDFEDDELVKGKEDQSLLSFLQTSFSLPRNLATQIAFAIAHASSPDEPVGPALHRTKRYLRSVGRYGSGAFLVGQYGGAGEIAQGFCRACAVKGGTYVLGDQAVATSIQIHEEQGVELRLPCHPRPITTKHLIASYDHLPLSLQPKPEPLKSGRSHAGTRMAHCIAILPSLPDSLKRKRGENPDSEAEESQEPKSDVEQDDTAVILFPPEGEVGLVRALLMGEGTGSCPSGQFVLYLFTAVSDPNTDPSALLRPYLSRLCPEPLFTAFYIYKPESTFDFLPDGSSASPPGVTVVKPYTAHGKVLVEGLDWEAEQGEAAFWSVMGGKPVLGEEVEGQGFFEKEHVDEEAEEDDA